MNVSDPYADAELQRALAEDVRVAELGIDIVTHADCVVLRGQVETQQRRAEIERQVMLRMPQRRVVNEIVVVEVHPPASAEELT